MGTPQIPSVDPDTKLFPDSVRAAGSFVTLLTAAKNPDLLIVGTITRDTGGVIQTAQVVWPDKTPGLFTTTGVDDTGAINGYKVSYGDPVTKTYTQPTITRDSSGAAITIPQIVVS